MKSQFFIRYRFFVNACTLYKSKIKFLLNGNIAITIFFLIFFLESKSQITDTTIFPLNDYLYTTVSNPYPLVNTTKLNAIDTSKFVNVMSYGAKGDGKTFDDAAITKAFAAAQYGVIFPSNKTFLVSKLSAINLSKDIIVYAYGATIKMADNKRYSALQFNYPTGSKTKNFIWLGGTLDGNKDHQSWPGSPTGNNTWAESHGRFLGVSWAQFALFKDITVINTVVDGIGLERNRIGVISDCKASGGARIAWSENAEQGTYFKCTRGESRVFYCNNVDCNGGSIGVHYSTSNLTTSDSSVTTIINSHFKNQSQNPVHFEDCRKIFLYNCTVEKDVSSEYDWDFQISNQTWIASIKKCHFRNIRLNFNQVSSLKLAIIDSCDFVSEYSDYQSALPAFIDGRATICINSAFKGKVFSKQSWVKNTRKCTFENFGNYPAIQDAMNVDSCTFNNGIVKPIDIVNGGKIYRCTFINCKTSNINNVLPADDSWKKIYLSFINILSDKNNYLGRIDCGQETQQLQNKLVSTAVTEVVTKESNVLKSSSINLYPNPTTDVVHVLLNEKISGKTTLNIYDQQGRIVQTKLLNKKERLSVETFDVQALSAGIYVLQIVNGEKKVSLKFVIK